MAVLAERLETARLVLRPPLASDAVSIFEEYAGDPEVTRYLMWRAHARVEDAIEFLASRQAQPKDGEQNWAITLKGQDRVIGMISVRTGAGFKADMGYVLGRAYWGRGLMTEAARAVAEEAFRLPGLYRLWATCDVGNLASARVLEKIGMRREGVLGRYCMHPNISDEPRDSLVYALIRDDRSAAR